MNILRILADSKAEVENLIDNKLPNSDGVGAGNLNNVLYWILGAAGMVAVGVIIYGGIKYLSSQGSPDKTKQASQIIAYAIIGLVIVALAMTITTFVMNTINGAAE